MLENLMTLGMLVLLQAVLGFDNLLYIALESKRAPEGSRASVRRWGIGLAVVFRIVLLFILIKVVGYFQEPFLTLPFTGIVTGTFNLHAMVVLLGGVFILYTAMKEIWHMMNLDEHAESERKDASTRAVVLWIVAVNVVFSFDSILSAMALTDVFWVMALAIVTGGVLMIWLADRVSAFLARNRMYEVLGLFILFVVGIMLLSEGGHLAHLEFFGYPITSMSKATFYFVITVLVLSDIVQSRYQKKLRMARGVSLADGSD